MPSFPIEITDSQDQPVDVSQLDGDERRTLLGMIDQNLFQVGVPQEQGAVADENLMLGDEWRVRYDGVAKKFMLNDLPDNKVDIVRNMAKIEMKDYGDDFGGETHYMKVVVPPGGGRRRRIKKTRKSKGKKARLTRRR
jgi:hypothetical protein